ncbi:DUF3784 domain-containing protein [Gordonibacter massiliensis (ex Traore et al. 2017)]|uniref:DUF3784 domain-containing protein n=1 Tax=Gordonibacter massiliensis (ex Traore et al. 2017) TaxID=1841863 RepID=A0A842JCG2_9ACTN|nr:DUF3784 domain-containing protein [Gordonibacter massiliensis (ex Traore et al. 2017)]MBC2889603.1 DUF3784 domain-containing protein [Gordonibacter massiliensis (ex Traore et al. 2017)]
MDILCILFSIPVFVVGAAFLQGRALSRSRAWRAVPEGEKARVNLNRVNRNLGCAVMLCGAVLLACGAVPGLRETALGPLMALWCVAVCADAVFISKSKRYIDTAAPVR